MTSIRRTTILFALAAFLLDQSSTIYARGERSANDDRADDVRPLNDRSASSSEIVDTGLSMEAPTDLLDRRETTDHRRNEERGISCGKECYRDMIAALSKIAKVQSADGYPFTVERTSTSDHAQDPRKSTLHRDTTFERPASNDVSNGTDGASSSEAGSFRCRSIRGDYATKIAEELPPYAHVCISGNKTFILSSWRFAEDHRSSFDVNIDDDTLRRLIEPSEQINGRFKIIPATLVLKAPYQNYVLQDRAETSSERSENTTTMKNIERTVSTDCSITIKSPYQQIQQ